MTSEYNKILERVEEFERTHIRTEIPKRRELIKQLYEDFLLIFDDCSATLEEYEDELDMTLFVPNILTCKEGGHCFNTLIYLAEITDMNISEGCIVIQLHFHLWEWVVV